MTAIHDLRWTKKEKAIAREAFDAAYARECETIRAKVAAMLPPGSPPEALWQVHDFLEERRRATDDKYDYRYSVLLEVFAVLIGEG